MFLKLFSWNEKKGTNGVDWGTSQVVLVLLDETLKEGAVDGYVEDFGAVGGALGAQQFVVLELGQLGAQRQVRVDQHLVAARVVQLVERKTCSTKKKTNLTNPYRTQPNLALPNLTIPNLT